jgi:glucokinase
MAIDVGVTNVKVGLINSRARIEHFAKHPTPIESGAGGVASVLVETCREVLTSSSLTTRDLLAVGCCVPGVVNPADGVIVASATPGWEGVDVRTPLEASIGRPVTIEGDGAAATLAFHTFGPTRGQDNLLGISIGTGISSGYITGGKLLRGAGQAALEAGHMPLFHPGRPCSCGRSGCWEAHVGGGALRKLLAEYRQAGHHLPALPEEVAELAQANEETSLKIWEEQGTLLGLGIAVLLNVLNPRTVVLGGGYSNAWSLFRKSLLKTARAKALTRNSEAAIVCAPEPERAPLLGAAVAAVLAQGPSDWFDDPGPSEEGSR